MATKWLNPLTREELEERCIINGPCTLSWYSDSDPATIIAIKKNKAGNITHLIIQEDSWTITKGSEQDGSAEYTYSRDPDGRVMTFRLRKNGIFVIEGQSLTATPRCLPGFRRRYYDPHF